MPVFPICVYLQASDEKQSDNTTLLVNIGDDNDNSPVFLHQSYHISIPELTPAQHSIASITATDADAGQNANITYTMIGTQAFHINSTTG